MCADYFEKREQDPGFIGFHRLEYGLFEQRSTQDLTPILPSPPLTPSAPPSAENWL